MKISEIDLQFASDYITLDYQDDKMVQFCMDSAKSAIIEYTGLKNEVLDEKENLSIVYLALCKEFYDNRGLTTDSDKVNKIVNTLMNMHSTNLL